MSILKNINQHLYNVFSGDGATAKAVGATAAGFTGAATAQPLLNAGTELFSRETAATAQDLMTNSVANYGMEAINRFAQQANLPSGALEQVKQQYAEHIQDKLPNILSENDIATVMDSNGGTLPESVFEAGGAFNGDSSALATLNEDALSKAFENHDLSNYYSVIDANQSTNEMLTLAADANSPWQLLDENQVNSLSDNIVLPSNSWIDSTTQTISGWDATQFATDRLSDWGFSSSLPEASQVMYLQNSNTGEIFTYIEGEGYNTGILQQPTADFLAENASELGLNASGGFVDIVTDIMGDVGTEILTGLGLSVATVGVVAGGEIAILIGVTALAVAISCYYVFSIVTKIFGDHDKNIPDFDDEEGIINDESLDGAANSLANNEETEKAQIAANEQNPALSQYQGQYAPSPNNSSNVTHEHLQQINNNIAARDQQNAERDSVYQQVFQKFGQQMESLRNGIENFVQNITQRQNKTDENIQNILEQQQINSQTVNGNELDPNSAVVRYTSNRQQFTPEHIIAEREQQRSINNTQNSDPNAYWGNVVGGPANNGGNSFQEQVVRNGNQSYGYSNASAPVNVKFTDKERERQQNYLPNLTANPSLA